MSSVFAFIPRAMPVFKALGQNAERTFIQAAENNGERFIKEGAEVLHNFKGWKLAVPKLMESKFDDFAKTVPLHDIRLGGLADDIQKLFAAIEDDGLRLIKKDDKIVGIGLNWKKPHKAIARLWQAYVTTPFKTRFAGGLGEAQQKVQKELVEHFTSTATEGATHNAGIYGELSSLQHHVKQTERDISRWVLSQMLEKGEAVTSLSVQQKGKLYTQIMSEITDKLRTAAAEATKKAAS